MLKVSIVTISFNQARFLRRTIESVRGQDYPNIEHIIVDPGSTDGSRKIINQYQDHFSQVILEPDGGPADGLHKGFESATGQILAQLNADDCYLPGAISRIVREFQNDPQLGIVYGNGIIANAQGTPIKRFFSDKFSLKGFTLGRVVICQQATFYTREAYQKVGGFNINNHTSWDAELMVDFAKKNIPMKKINTALGVFTYHAASITGSQLLKDESFQNHERIFEKITGRPRTKLDRYLLKLGIIGRIIRSPQILYYRLLEKIISPSFGIQPEILDWIRQE